tara:strand:+ start:1153 stop:2721 length:1569 start_codon:yes stop_codon:yes gene_type:complete
MSIDKSQQAAEILLKRQEAYDTLLGFTEFTFPQFVVAEHHRLICEKLQEIEAGDINRLMIFMPPRHGKSELASRRFPAWFMGRNPNSSIIHASYGQELATDFGRDVREIVNSEEYSKVFEGKKLSQDATAANKWRIADHRGEYFAVGVGTSATGRGADLLIIDDPIKNREDADSLVERERVWGWFRSTAFTRLQPNAKIIVIQTRWHDDDLSGRLIQQTEDNADLDDWEILRLSAEAMDDDPIGRKKGEALWPEWYDKKALKEIRSVLGEREYHALYQQEPTRAEGSFFHTDWFDTYEHLPPHTTLRFYGTSDYATSERSGADYTVHIVFGVDPYDRIYVVDVWKKRAKPQDWIEAVIDLMKKWKVTQWGEERGQILNSVGPYLSQRMKERGTYCFRKQYTPSKDKTVRARSIQGRAQQGMILFPKGKNWAHEVIQTLTSFPAGRHDDEVDCFSLLGIMLEELTPGRPLPDEESPWGARSYTFEELMHRGTLRRQGKRTVREAPIVGNHEPIPYEEHYSSLL